MVGWPSAAKDLIPAFHDPAGQEVRTPRPLMEKEEDGQPRWHSRSCVRCDR